MKKIITFLIALIFAFSLSVNLALAAGDKVHGEKAAGDPPQYCIQPDGCPWEN